MTIARTKRAPWGDSIGGDLFAPSRTKPQPPTLLDMADARAAAEAPAKSDKGTVWEIKDQDCIAEIDRCVKLAADFKLAKERLETSKRNLQTVAEFRWYEYAAKHGEFPPGPIKLVTPTGTEVGFVAKDCSLSAKVQSPMLATLATEGVGGDQSATVKTYKLDSAVLAEKARGEILVGEMLSAILLREAKKGVFHKGQVERLLVCEPKTVWNPGLLDRKSVV